MRKLFDSKVTSSIVRSFLTGEKVGDNKVIAILTVGSEYNPFVRRDVYSGVDYLESKGYWVNFYPMDSQRDLDALVQRGLSEGWVEVIV